MRPAFISEDTAAQVLLIGKSINFIRLCCHDAEWVMDSNSGAACTGLEYGDETKLMEVVATTGAAANKRLLQILFEKYKLMQHLTALKRFLLMGQVMATIKSLVQTY